MSQTGGDMRDKCGFTLVEVMISILLVVVLSAGGMSYTYHSARMIADQKDARMADLMANRRMDLLLGTPVAKFVAEASALGVADGGYFYATYLPASPSGYFEVSKINPQEKVTIDGKTWDVQTRLRFVDTQSPGKTTATSCLEMDIRVSYGPDKKRSVILRNYHAGS